MLMTICPCSWREGNLTNAMVERISHQDMPAPIDEDPKWIRQTGLQGRPSISRAMGLADTGHPVNAAGRSLPSADQMVVGIGDQKITLPIDGNP
jgi:hypothetical protein